MKEKEEPLPRIGGAKYHAWHEVRNARDREEERDLPPLVQIVPEPDAEIPAAPSGRPPFRKIEGSLFLPEPVAQDVQRHAEESDKQNIPPIGAHEEEEITSQQPAVLEPTPTLGGGGGGTISFRSCVRC